MIEAQRPESSLLKATRNGDATMTVHEWKPTDQGLEYFRMWQFKFCGKAADRGMRSIG